MSSDSKKNRNKDIPPISPFAGEKPLVILKPNPSQLIQGVIVMVLVLLGSTFGILLPVLMTGDFGAIWLARGKAGVQEIGLFYMSWIAIPAILYFLVIIIHKSGTYYFYHSGLVLHTYWTKRTVIMPYNEMHVTRHAMGVSITRESLPDRSERLKRFKIQHWDGVGFGTNFEERKVMGMKYSKSYWDNPKNGPKALALLKDRAFSYIEK